MIQLNQVSKTYFSQPVLEAVDLKLDQGQFLYVLGGSGAGKSSLLRLLATEEAPTRGDVSLFGYNLARISPSTLRTIRQSIGYIPQAIQLVPDLSVYENVALGLMLAGSRKIRRQGRERIDEVLTHLALHEKRNQKAEFLSGGEKQRVAIARAFVRSPELIIADEPTGAQDRRSVWRLMELFLSSNRQGATILFATHDSEIVNRVNRPCVRLETGRLTQEGRACF